MKHRLCLVLLVSIFLIILGLHIPINAGIFSSKPQDAIIGKWLLIGGDETIEFFKDGTVSIVKGKDAMAGNYKFIDKDRLRLDLGGFGAIAGPAVIRVSISGDELTLTDPAGGVSRYYREDSQTKTRKYIINPQFDGAITFHEGLANVRTGNKMGFIDKSGKYIINPQFDSAHAFNEELAAVEAGNKC